MPQVIEKARASLKPDPDNPRKTADEEYIARLAADIKLRGVVVPLLIRPDDVIIDGWCRWLAALIAGLEKLPCIVTAQNLDPAQILAMQMATVMHRADISGYEKWQAVERMRALNPKLQQKDVAFALSLSESMIVRLSSPGKCSDAWRAALQEGQVGISDCYAASKIEGDEAQNKLLSFKLGGASRDALEREGRKARSGAKPTVKLARVRCPLSTGTTVVVSGAEMDMEGLIEALASALDAARKANKESLDVRTFEKVLKDKAKVAG